jgi:hypothetical protein
MRQQLRPGSSKPDDADALFLCSCNGMLAVAKERVVVMGKKAWLLSTSTRDCIDGFLRRGDNRTIAAG